MRDQPRPVRVDIAAVVVSAAGVLIALYALLYSVQIGRRANLLAEQTAKLASDQHKMQLALKHDIVERLIMIYRNLDDFNEYLWLVLESKQAIDRMFVHDFYQARVEELTRLRSQAAYAEFLRAMHDFKPGHKLSEDELRAILQSAGYMSESERDKLVSTSAGKELSTLLLSLETNTWWSLMQTTQKIKHLWIPDEELTVPGALLEGRDAEEQKEILYIMKVAMHTMERASFLLALLRHYEADLLSYLETQYEPSDLE